MSIRLREPDGSVWEFDTPEEARAFRATTVTDPPRPAPPSPIQTPPQPPRRAATAGGSNGTAALAQALIDVTPVGGWSSTTGAEVRAALKAMVEAGERGVLGDDLAPILKLKGPKGLAGGAASIRKYLARVLPAGLDQDKVFWRTEHRDGPATWHVDSKIVKEYVLNAF